MMANRIMAGLGAWDWGNEEKIRQTKDSGSEMPPTAPPHEAARLRRLRFAVALRSVRFIGKLFPTAKVNSPFSLTTACWHGFCRKNVSSDPNNDSEIYGRAADVTE
jgi:hypothetical protein